MSSEVKVVCGPCSDCEDNRPCGGLKCTDGKGNAWWIYGNADNEDEPFGVYAGHDANGRIHLSVNLEGAKAYVTDLAIAAAADRNAAIPRQTEPL